MKVGKKKSGFVDVALAVGAVCAAVTAVGLFVPSLHPVSFVLGTGLFFVVATTAVGVLVYAGWRIVTYAVRNHRRAAPARTEIYK